MIGYPKTRPKKKRQRHKPSILQRKEDRHRCYICMHLKDDFSKKYVEEHHIFGGPLRSISEAEGFKVYLCPEHHRTGPDAVHKNAMMSKALKAAAQYEYEKTHTRRDFMALIHKNYLVEDEQ